jgi:serine/threonine protein kinase
MSSSIIYKNIMEEGEVTEEMFLKFFKMAGISIDDNIDSLQVKVSNGLSAVFLYKNEAFQVFKSYKTAERIYSLLQNINTNISHDIDLGLDDYVKVNYNLSDYIPKICTYDSHCIIWERIISLNSFEKIEIKSIIEKNILKLLWDIGKALSGLHKNGIKHGDATIDNIGIKGDNFVLFDFDSSKSAYTFQNDYAIFIQSIKFNLGDLYKNIANCIPEQSSNFLERMAKQKDLSFFEELKIIR